VATLACQDSDTDQSHTINILQQIRDLQSAQDAEAAEIGGEFGDLDPANSKRVISNRRGRGADHQSFVHQRSSSG
jgi:hypothetical protein